MKKLFLFLAVCFTYARAQAACQAAFTYTQSAGTFNFTDASTTTSGSVSQWLWTFGDNSLPSSQQNPSHTYAACGYYIVTLNIFTSSFCTSSISDTVLVTSGFTGSFTATVDTTTGNVQFNAQPASSHAIYNWDFGDASTGTGVAPTHLYAPGTYTVCVAMADTDGICSDTVCNVITVYVAPTNCSATFTNTPIGTGNESFTATPFNLGWTYSWDYGDSNTGNGFFSTHQYLASGTYTVCLTVTDSANNCTSNFCDTVNIAFPTSCPPSFTANGLNGTYIFTASPLSIQNTYSWDFGDGSPAGSGVVANHTYTTAGTYTVCLTMTTQGGCVGVTCDTITVVTGVDESSLLPGSALFPNPADQDIMVSYTLSSSANVQLQVFDLSGRVLWSADKGSQAGAQRSDVDVSSLAPGVYFFGITANGQRTILKFVKS